MLAEAIVDESFQHIAWRHGQSFKPGCGIELEKFSQRNSMYVGTKPFGGAPLKHISGMAIAKALDHDDTLSWSNNNVKRYYGGATAREGGRRGLMMPAGKKIDTSVRWYPAARLTALEKSKRSQPLTIRWN